MSIKLIAIDVDGTLLNSRKELTAATVEAIQAAEAQGIRVCICSGRPISDCREYIDRLPSMRYIVTCTGAQVIDLQTGADIFRNALTAEELRMLYAIICRYDTFPEIFDDAGGVHNRVSDLTKEVVRDEAMLALLLRMHIAEEDLDAYVANYTGLTNKIHMFFKDLTHKPKLREELEALPYEVMESDFDDLEIMPRGVDKAVGLAKLAEHLGLKAEEVLALGDGGNDAAMLRWAGLGVAMKNASAEAKAAADRVSDHTNDEDGAAHVIWTLLKGELI